MDKPQEINGFQVFVVEDEHEGGKVAFFPGVEIFAASPVNFKVRCILPSFPSIDTSLYTPPNAGWW